MVKERASFIHCGMSLDWITSWLKEPALPLTRPLAFEQVWNRFFFLFVIIKKKRKKKKWERPGRVAMPILVVSWVRRCRKREWTTARQIGIAVLERFSASHAIACTPTHTKCRPFSSRPMLTMDRKCPQSIHLKVNCYASLSDNPIKHADQRCQQAISRGPTRMGKRSKKKADAFRKKDAAG